MFSKEIETFLFIIRSIVVLVIIIVVCNRIAIVDESLSIFLNFCLLKMRAVS